MPKVAVLGCGPSGMVAAHAARTAGYEVDIFSKMPRGINGTMKSTIYGAQFLHQPIPELECGQGHWVDWIHTKDADKDAYYPYHYLRKVYGDAWDGTVSDEMFNRGQQAYDLRGVYDSLWSMYASDVHVLTYTQAMLRALTQNFDEVISTIPRKTICMLPKDHAFQGTVIWAVADNPEALPTNFANNTIVYNGEPFPSWYRASKIFGSATVEWPFRVMKPPIQGVARVEKPVGTTCDCWPNVHKVGRYGLWQKGVLLHQVYDQAMQALTAPKQGVLFP